ncbi:unknown [Prevotella sp. CAG:1124]|nr:unknown [Prevotella sp. CAG:1124]
MIISILPAGNKNMPLYHVKGRLLQPQRRSFSLPKAVFYNPENMIRIFIWPHAALTMYMNGRIHI